LLVRCASGGGWNAGGNLPVAISLSRRAFHL